MKMEKIYSSETLDSLQTTRSYKSEDLKSTKFADGFQNSQSSCAFKFSAISNNIVDAMRKYGVDPTLIIVALNFCGMRYYNFTCSLNIFVQNVKEYFETAVNTVHSVFGCYVTMINNGPLQLDT